MFFQNSLNHNIIKKHVYPINYNNLNMVLKYIETNKVKKEC